MTSKQELIKNITAQIASLLDKGLETSNLSQGGMLNSAQLVLPKSVDELPDSAKEEFISVYKSTDGGEETKLSTAWKAVKRKWKKVEPEDSEDEESADHEQGETPDEEKTEDENGKKKKKPFWMKKDVLGPIVGDVDQLRRQLITDGYPEAAEEVQMVADSGWTMPLALDSIPHGYRETISERYFHARKDLTENADEAFEVQVAFKALLDERKITYGVVYPANEVDLQKEWATENVIENAAHNFMANYRQHDTFHNERAGAGVPVESFIAPCDITEFHGKRLTPDQVIKKGSWIMATKWNDDTWNLVKSGKIKGYSIGGFKRVRR